MATVFSMIKSRQIPGHFVYEDDIAFAILTIEPIAQGHVLVIPNAEVDHFDDLDEATAAHLMIVAQRVAKAIKAEFDCVRVGVMIAGLEVPHCHVHVLPINGLGDLSFAKAASADQDDLADVAMRLKRHID